MIESLHCTNVSFFLLAKCFCHIFLNCDCVLQHRRFLLKSLRIAWAPIFASILTFLSFSSCRHFTEHYLCTPSSIVIVFLVTVSTKLSSLGPSLSQWKLHPSNRSRSLLLSNWQGECSFDWLCRLKNQRRTLRHSVHVLLVWWPRWVFSP